MESSSSIPNLFVLGAPKCGTSSLNYYLDQHPNVLMAPKELHFFGSDLGIIQDELTEEQYLNYFSSTKEKVLGESSVWYLYSKLAASEILNFNRDAKLVVMLRNPLDFIESLHAQFVYDGDEKENRLSKAIRNEHYGASVNFESRPSYLEAAKFGSQLERYFDLFRPEQLKIILLEDLKSSPEGVYKDCLSFLELEPFEPSFEIVNPRTNIRSAKMQHLLRSRPSALKKIAKTLLPHKAIRHSIMSSFENLNTGSKSKKLSEIERKELLSLIKPEIQILENLLSRNLKHWC